MPCHASFVRLDSNLLRRFSYTVLRGANKPALVSIAVSTDASDVHSAEHNPIHLSNLSEHIQGSQVCVAYEGERIGPLPTGSPLYSQAQSVG